jgi:hypothetical protein
MKHRFYAQPLDPIPVEQLVVDGEARLGRKVIGGVQAGEEAVALAWGVVQPAQHGEDLGGVDYQCRLTSVEAGV